MGNDLITVRRLVDFLVSGCACDDTLALCAGMSGTLTSPAPGTPSPSRP